MLRERKSIILDLFVFHALEDDELFLKAISLIETIIRKCHKIVLTPSLKKEYAKKLKNLKKIQRQVHKSTDPTKSAENII